MNHSNQKAPFRAPSDAVNWLQYLQPCRDDRPLQRIGINHDNLFVLLLAYFTV